MAADEGNTGTGKDSTFPFAGQPIPFIRIRGVYGQMPPSELKVADFVLEHPDEVIHCSVTELAQRLEVSESTVVRFCQRLDYQGYHEFKILLARDMGAPFMVSYDTIDIGDDVKAVTQKTIRLLVQALQDTLGVLEPGQVEKVAVLMENAAHIYIFGCGGSGGIAEVGRQRLLRVGLRCTTCTDPDTQTLLAGVATPDDVVLGVSYSGHNEDVVRALRVAKERKASVIAITNYPNSPAAKVADIALLSGAAETELLSEGGPSRVAQLAIIDVICSYLIVRQHRGRKE